MLEITRQNFDGERIMSNMTAFKNAIDGLAKCYRERNPNTIAPSGIILVGLKLEDREAEMLIDEKAKEHNGFSPYGWQRMDHRHMTVASKFQSINGYKFT